MSQARTRACIVAAAKGTRAVSIPTLPPAENCLHATHHRKPDTHAHRSQQHPEADSVVSPKPRVKKLRLREVQDLA